MGKRIVHVRKERKKKQFALFMKELCSKYPKAKKIKVVLGPPCKLCPIRIDSSN